MNINIGGSFRIDGDTGKVARDPESTAPQTKAGPPENPEALARQPDTAVAPAAVPAAAPGETAKPAGKTK